jgi:hypothetical protein
MPQPRRRVGHRGSLRRVITRNLHQKIGFYRFSTERPVIVNPAHAPTRQRLT